MLSVPIPVIGSQFAQPDLTFVIGSNRPNGTCGTRNAKSEFSRVEVSSQLVECTHMTSNSLIAVSAILILVVLIVCLELHISRFEARLPMTSLHRSIFVDKRSKPDRFCDV